MRTQHAAIFQAELPAILQVFGLYKIQHTTRPKNIKLTLG